MKRLCVFCGSTPGTRPAYANAARGLGTLLAARNVTLVYGGSASGLMRAVADTVLGAGGTVIGVIPRALVDREVAHTGLTQLHIVRSMHERKQKMADLSDGFVALPGGFGTLDETAEMLTWRQLGLHDKACGLLNVAGFFTPLLRFFDHAVEEGFIVDEQRRTLIADDDPARLLDRLGF